MEAPLAVTANVLVEHIRKRLVSSVLVIHYSFPLTSLLNELAN